MSILFVLLTFLVIISISYFMRHGQVPLEDAERVQAAVPAQKPMMVRESGFEVPKGFCFHPGHTWVSRRRPPKCAHGNRQFRRKRVRQDRQS